MFLCGSDILWPSAWALSNYDHSQMDLSLWSRRSPSTDPPRDYEALKQNPQRLYRWFRFNKVTAKACLTKGRWTGLWRRRGMFSLHVIWSHWSPSCVPVGEPSPSPPYSGRQGIRENGHFTKIILIIEDWLETAPLTCSCVRRDAVFCLFVTCRVYP